MSKQKPVPPEVLSDWQKIDQGCFGWVCKAWHNQLKIPVAVKILKNNDSQCLKEIRSEMEKMDSASVCTYVIHLIGIVEESPIERNPGIVMQYMEYGSLHTLMEKVNCIPWALKFRILHEVAVGMNWLHTLSPPLLHLDLKTKNILINDDLHIKITDFGLSKYTSGSSVCKPEDCEYIGGTPEYMPPEAFQKQYQPHKSTDIYSFAILSVVLLTEEEPYPANLTVLIRQCVPEGQRPSIVSLVENESSVKSLPEAVQFIMKCWDNDRLKRPPFSECCIQWEKFKSAYDKNELKTAVREVQDKLDENQDCATKGVYSNKTVSDSVGTTEMEELFSEFPKMQISKSSSFLQKAVPGTNSPNQHIGPTPYQNFPKANQLSANQRHPQPPVNQGLNRHEAVPGTNSPYQHIGPTPYQSFPKANQPSANQRHPQLPVNQGLNSQGFQGNPQLFFHNRFGFLGPAYPPPRDNPAPSSIVINNSTGPLQIGDNCVMHVMKYPSSNVGLTTPQRQQQQPRIPRTNSIPTSTRPSYPTMSQANRPVNFPVGSQRMQTFPPQASDGSQQQPAHDSFNT